MTAALRAWPRRRWIAAGGAFPVMIALLMAAGRGVGATSAAWWAWPWLLVTGGLAALVLVSYLAAPGSGKLIEVGCSPCAAVSALAVGAALMAHASAPGSPLMAIIATGLTLAAVRQRLTDATVCPAQPPSPPLEPPGEG